MRTHRDADDWALERGHIFAIYSELGIEDADERHRLQHAVTGCSSLRYMTRGEHLALIETLESLIEKSYAERNRVMNGLLALTSFNYTSYESKGDF